MYIIDGLENKKVFYGLPNQRLIDRLRLVGSASPEALPPPKAASANISKG